MISGPSKAFITFFCLFVCSIHNPIRRFHAPYVSAIDLGLFRVFIFMYPIIKLNVPRVFSLFSKTIIVFYSV